MHTTSQIRTKPASDNRAYSDQGRYYAVNFGEHVADLAKHEMSITLEDKSYG